MLIGKNAGTISDFFQAQPYFGQEPSRKTVAKLLTSEEALYCLVICYDDYQNIEQKKGKLDDGGGDIVSLRSSGKIEQVIAGFLIAYNYSPKSWIYFAVNEIRERDDFSIMRIADRAAVLKASYLYYF